MTFRVLLYILGLRPEVWGAAPEILKGLSGGAQPPPHIRRHSRNRQSRTNVVLARLPRRPEGELPLQTLPEQYTSASCASVLSGETSARLVTMRFVSSARTLSGKASASWKISSDVAMLKDYGPPAVCDKRATTRATFLPFRGPGAKVLAAMLRRQRFTLRDRSGDVFSFGAGGEERANQKIERNRRVAGFHFGHT
ncbi:MAG: hypothetical protein QOF62_1611 [Pyrinomonadaceae bacterium]|nr:hypothetical protein [Pyrinomonadaceae bacterium]